MDVSQFESDADKARFARAFADRFFFRKKAAPSAVHVFIEECQEFAPQNPQREEAALGSARPRIPVGALAWASPARCSLAVRITSRISRPACPAYCRLHEVAILLSSGRV